MFDKASVCEQSSQKLYRQNYLKLDTGQGGQLLIQQLTGQLLIQQLTSQLYNWLGST